MMKNMEKSKNQEEIEQKLEKIKNEKDIVQEYIKIFNEKFKTLDTNKVNTNILESIFRDFVDQVYKPTKKYQFILDKIVEVEKELKLNLNARQKELLEIYEFLQFHMIDESSLQSFLFGYTLANELKIEAKNYNNNDVRIKQQIRNINNKIE